ncbi:unnamed protein product [Acanthoscelides obtectus]|uniref:Transposase Tc1-like domain-containing protein n=1 Tax=Acanthoscelides obtectus TaxID=200917 RepID=A0A9P0LSN0_ACAOB|nr:unnamed protein product [Acanthoscelides obtectus]CAK1683781.1 hypothetical protein AOBTE_LOCUS34450 [Acanthoscelides obtectus]
MSLSHLRQAFSSQHKVMERCINRKLQLWSKLIQSYDNNLVQFNASKTQYCTLTNKKPAAAGKKLGYSFRAKTSGLEYCSHVWGAVRLIDDSSLTDSLGTLSHRRAPARQTPLTLQLSQQECLAELLSVFGNEAPHQSTISRWYGEFKRGRVGLSDDPRVDRHVTYREIEASLKISKTTIQKFLHEEIGVRKLVARWIPHLLTEEQKAARVNWCQKTLDREEKPTKIIRSRSVSENMVTAFVSKAGHIATIPLNEQRAVTADWYITICLPKIITELRKINPERRIILRQGNASSHTAQKTRQYLTEENVPDLSPNDFLLSRKLKTDSVDAFKNAVLDLPATEWNKCFENWFERMQMCIIFVENTLKISKVI